MKKSLCILLLLTMIGLIAARYSDQFPLGTYSYLSESWIQVNQDKLNYVSGEMKQLGYNSTIMQTHNPAADLTTIYSRLDADSIDVVMSDRAWSNTGGNEKYATTGLTTSSYYKFEAEYKDGSSVTGTDLTDSQYWYGSRDEDMPGTTYDINRLGFPFPAVVIPLASNNYVWRCEPNPDPNVLSPGWAYTDLRWRWLNRDNGNIRIGREFFLKKKYSSDPAQDSLYIKFHLRFRDIPSSDELPGNTILLSFSPVGFQYTYNTDGSISGHEVIPTPIEHTGSVSKVGVNWFHPYEEKG